MPASQLSSHRRLYTFTATLPYSSSNQLRNTAPVNVCHTVHCQPPDIQSAHLPRALPIPQSFHSGLYGLPRKGPRPPSMGASLLTHCSSVGGPAVTLSVGLTSNSLQQCAAPSPPPYCTPQPNHCTPIQITAYASSTNTRGPSPHGLAPIQLYGQPLLPTDPGAGSRVSSMNSYLLQCSTAGTDTDITHQ